MSVDVDAMIEAMHEFTLAAPVRLDRTAIAEFREIFMQTVGNFVNEAVTPADVWSDDTFRNFILGQVRRIAIASQEAASRAGAGSANGRIAVDASTLTGVAVDVMVATERTCRIRMVQGRMRNPPGSPEGQVCTTFLRAVLGG
jgi:hypothetical protein